MVIALNNMYRVLNLKKIFEISENEKIIFENMNLEIDNNKITVISWKKWLWKNYIVKNDSWFGRDNIWEYRFL